MKEKQMEKQQVPLYKIKQLSLIAFTENLEVRS